MRGGGTLDLELDPVECSSLMGNCFSTNFVSCLHKVPGLW